MKTLLLLVFLSIAACTSTEELSDRRSGTTYIVDNRSYGDLAVVRDYGYTYYVISFQNLSELRPGYTVHLVPSFEAYIHQPTIAYVNENYLLKIPVQVFYKTQNRDEAYRKLIDIL